MPVYEYRCEAGHEFERILSTSDYLLPQTCGCGQGAEKVIRTPPRVFSDYAGYESPATGRWIEGRRARLEDLAVSGCRPYEEGMKQDAERYRAAEEAKLDKTVDRIVDQTLAELVT
jgi:putative FmdB family regulatory protein